MVGYRIFAEGTADRIGGIQGTVQNLLDGSTVEIVAEGLRRALEEFLEELKIGPAHALVRSVKVDWDVVSGEFDGFEAIH